MALLGQNNSDILSKLIEDTNFCDWMTDNELVLLKMDLQMNAADQMTSDQWKDLDSISHNCTPDVAFKILNLIERMLCTQKIDQCIENQIAIFLQNEDSDIREKVYFPQNHSFKASNLGSFINFTNFMSTDERQNELHCVLVAFSTKKS